MPRNLARRGHSQIIVKPSMLLSLSRSLLIVLVSVVSAKKEMPLPDPPTTMEEMRDVLLFTGSFKWMFWLCLFGYCMAVYRVVLDLKPTIRYAHGLVLGIVSATGGSTIAAILCGKPVPIVANEALIPALAATWSVMYMLPDQCLAVIKNTSMGSIFARCSPLATSPTDATPALIAFAMAPAASPTRRSGATS